MTTVEARAAIRAAESVGVADDCLDKGSQVHIPGCRGEVGRVVDVRPRGPGWAGAAAGR